MRDHGMRLPERSLGLVVCAERFVVFGGDVMEHRVAAQLHSLLQDDITAAVIACFVKRITVVVEEAEIFGQGAVQPFAVFDEVVVPFGMHPQSYFSPLSLSLYTDSIAVVESRPAGGAGDR